MILINRTYTTVTPESAEHGEPSDTGFVAEDVEYTFRELVDLIQRGGFTNPSNSRPTGTIGEWLENEPERDYSDGSTTTEAIHYSRNNKRASARYWRLAWIAAGIFKHTK